MLARIQNEQNHADRRKERDDKRKSQRQPVMVSPSPALVRHGSKQGTRVPAALTPGQLTPHSAQAQIHIPIGSNQRSSNTHPYAAAGLGAGYEYARQQDHYKGQVQQPYGRQSPMVASFAATPAVVNNVRPGNAANIGQDYQQQEDPRSKPAILRILTCRCWFNEYLHLYWFLSRRRTFNHTYVATMIHLLS